MSKLIARTGNEAAATAMRQVEPDVCAAYPITPSTQVMENYSQFAADGKVKTALVLVESEHSAMSACVGASSAGARVMTATSSQGLALMHEVLYIASGLRLPIVMAIANRALSAPINIHGDQSDAMGSRDSGWIQLYAENAQEVYHTTLQAVRIAEHPEVLLPVMVCFDGFTISHSMEAVEILDDDAVKDFVGIYSPQRYLLDIDHPHTVGAMVLPDFYTEMKRQQREAMRRALEVIREVDQEFVQRFGKSYGLFEEYRLGDAEVATVVLGSTAGMLKEAVDRARERGVKAGLLRLRSFRPFPGDGIAQALCGLTAVAVLDRADAAGTPSGPMFEEVRSALYEQAQRPRISGFVYGLGGREMLPSEADGVYELLANAASGKGEMPTPEYLSVRG
jgi:pyruvate ferredoxin oxidoreductase alpha subunit